MVFHQHIPGVAENTCRQKEKIVIILEEPHVPINYLCNWKKQKNMLASVVYVDTLSIVAVILRTGSRITDNWLDVS